MTTLNIYALVYASAGHKSPRWHVASDACRTLCGYELPGETQVFAYGERETMGRMLDDMASADTNPRPICTECLRESYPRPRYNARTLAEFAALTLPETVEA